MSIYIFIYMAKDLAVIFLLSIQSSNAWPARIKLVRKKTTKQKKKKQLKKQTNRLKSIFLNFLDFET